LAARADKFGPLSVSKLEQAIDVVIERHDPGARRRIREAARGGAVGVGKPDDTTGTASLWGRTGPAGVAVAREAGQRIDRRWWGGAHPLLAELIANGATVKPIPSPGVEPEPRYRPSAGLAAFVRMRDMTCMFPGCHRPAEYCDVDHTRPYPGGATHTSNTKCLCRHHHLLKTHWTGWADYQLPDGTVV
jgi:hypothetical protein